MIWLTSRHYPQRASPRGNIAGRGPTSWPSKSPISLGSYTHYKHIDKCSNFCYSILMERKPRPTTYWPPLREQPPYEPIDIDAFGLDPENNAKDRARLAESRNDVWLLTLMVTKDSLGEQRRAGQAYPDNQTQAEFLTELIQAREAFIDALYSPEQPRP